MASDNDGGGFSTYIHDDAPLYRRVDFLGMIADIGKGALIALFSVLAGVVVALQRSIGEVSNAIFVGFTVVGNALLTVPNTIAAQAFGSAEAQLPIFGVFSLPAATVVAVATVVGVSFIIYIFWEV